MSAALVVILGGTSAIAQAYARRRAAAGVRFALVGRREERLKVIAVDLVARGAASAESVVMDLSAIAEIESAVEMIHARFGTPQEIVIAYGVLGEQTALERDLAAARAALDVNFTSAALWLLAFLKRHDAAQALTAVVIGSVAGDRGRRTNFIYGAAKGGLDIFVQGLAHAYAGTPVRFVMVKPGFVDTPMTAAFVKSGPLWSSPDRVAADIERAVRRGTRVVYTPWFWRPIMAVIRRLPWFVFRRLKIERVVAKIAITGAAGLVGQNLIPRLKARGYRDIVAIDKHAANTALLRRLHPEITVLEADLAQPGAWQHAVADIDIIVICHAQIGGQDRATYARNNIAATERLLAAVARPGVYLVHVSSSVVKSMAKDDYIWSKEAQEKLVLQSGFSAVVLRPTLMFGWFDRKHLGWLSQFMQRSPLFPIPGHGRYLRQPLYVGDFCDIVMACIERRPTGEYNITGLEPIDYIDLIRAVEDSRGSARIVPVPYRLFWSMLFVYGLFSRDPPFTTKQLEALATPDVFEVIDWPGLFGVKPTPLKSALAETYRDPVYSRIVLEF